MMLLILGAVLVMLAGAVCHVFHVRHRHCVHQVHGGIRVRHVHVRRHLHLVARRARELRHGSKALDRNGQGQQPEQENFGTRDHGR